MRPTFYDQSKVGTLFLPRIKQVEKEADSLQLSAAANDKPGNRIALLIIDMQIDFCHQLGELYVPGAEEDIRRLCSWILDNIEKLTAIFGSLDSHLLFQIFFRSWWQLQNGQKPDYFTEVYKDEPANRHSLTKCINNGEIRPSIDPIASIDYTEKLMAQANKPLCIWTYHTLIGFPGQALDPALAEVLAYHAFARKSQLNFLQKGQIPQTEMYGILCPEVKIPTHKQGGFNTDFLNILAKYDKLIVAGQAKSHCVLATLLQMYNFFLSTDKSVLKKIVIFEDCMSSVKHPAIDFESITQKEFDKFRNDGINIVKSTDYKL